MLEEKDNRTTPVTLNHIGLEFRLTNDTRSSKATTIDINKVQSVRKTVSEVGEAAIESSQRLLFKRNTKFLLNRYITATS